MTNVKRINPRRPYRLTDAGLRRIVLGEIASGENQSNSIEVPRLNARKPLRTNPPIERWHMAIAHSSQGRLDDHAREAIAAAAILATPVTGVVAVILGGLHENAAEIGIDVLVLLPELDAARFQPDREAAVIETFLEQYRPDHVFMPDNMLGDGDLGRRLIAKRGDPSATHVIEIDARRVSVSWAGGADRASAPLPRFVLLERGAVDANLPFVGLGALASPPEMPSGLDGGSYRDLGLEPTEGAAISLEEADVVVSAGNGVQRVETIETLARSLGAVVGASRVAVDDGKFPRDRQVGASGKTVSATTYFAVGISGAVQHLQGIKDCRHVIAINRDAGAPIAKRADLTVIGDAEDLMQALITRVEQAKNQRAAPEAK